MGDLKIGQVKINKALIVDDDEISRFLIEHVINQLGVVREIVSITNGKEAVEFYLASGKNYPDLVILDIRMPLLDGFEFLDWYESNGLSGKSKFVILTSSERDIDMDKAKEYQDIIGYISKPLTSKNIRKVVLQLV